MTWVRVRVQGRVLVDLVAVARAVWEEWEDKDSSFHLHFLQLRYQDSIRTGYQHIHQ